MKSKVGILYCLSHSLFLLADFLVFLPASKSLEFLNVDKVHLYFLAATLGYYIFSVLSTYLFNKFVPEFDRVKLVLTLTLIALGYNLTYVLMPWEYIQVWMSLGLAIVSGSIGGPIYIAIDSAMDKRITKEQKSKVISKKYYWAGLFAFAAFISCYYLLKTPYSVKATIVLACVTYVIFICLYIRLHKKNLIKNKVVVQSNLEIDAKASKKVYILFSLFVIFSLLLNLAEPVQTMQIKLLLNLNHEYQFIYGAFYYIGSIVGSLLAVKVLNKIKDVLWLFALFTSIGVYFFAMGFSYVLVGCALYACVVLLSTVFRIFIRNYLHTKFSGRSLEIWLYRLETTYSLSVLLTIVSVMMLSAGGSYTLTWGVSFTTCIVLMCVSFVLIKIFVKRIH